MEGYYVIHILDSFQKVGLLHRLRGGAGLEQLCEAFGYDPSILAPLLEYVATRSAVIRKTVGGYILASDSADTNFALHVLDQYAGAYGPCLRALPAILSGQRDGAQLVDLSRHAAAFAHADREQVDPDILRLLGEMGISNLLDIGCSTGGLTIEYGLRYPEAHCIGLDASES
ncbi:class I SAM-dependent methyltransferase [uncultured Tateyamaria sp.]|uniref:class I SAM-dependent methyltransferase n=1 Tax=uncultured Tateyamaria sp. TaxID=455651 RepID=UPI0026374B2A|nr:class I SAM-dependent methyltransferase [uncultured Tateyamaria sp.]